MGIESRLMEVSRDDVQALMDELGCSANDARVLAQKRRAIGFIARDGASPEVKAILRWLVERQR